jgi:hypothetical protein
MLQSHGVEFVMSSAGTGGWERPVTSSVYGTRLCLVCLPGYLLLVSLTAWLPSTCQPDCLVTLLHVCLVTLLLPVCLIAQVLVCVTV